MFTCNYLSQLSVIKKLGLILKNSSSNNTEIVMSVK